MSSTNATTASLTLNVLDAALVDFGVQVMLRGFFIGTACVFLLQAFRLYRQLRTWIVFCDIIQLLFFIVFQLIVAIYLIAPASGVDCRGRQYAAPLFFVLTVMTVWILHFLKFWTLYRHKKFITYGMLLLCMIASVGQITLLVFSSVATDKLQRCRFVPIGPVQRIQVASDMIIRIFLSAFFVSAIFTHTTQNKTAFSNAEGGSKGKSAAGRKSRFMFLLTADVRATFVDTVALIFKFALTMLDVTNVLIFFHVVDWIKIASTHWFVHEVSQTTTQNNNAVAPEDTVSLGGGGNNRQSLSWNPPASKFRVLQPIEKTEEGRHSVVEVGEKGVRVEREDRLYEQSV
ncbi:hypothetical protein HK102_005103 [Quaeritorhiza haematococci]|nr:hypothetical protein HK102_005103 [Quaeritorhiza haematococci]